MPQKDEKHKAVDLAITQIERQFGKGAIMRWGSEQVIDVPVIPTGALSLDIALGVGGIPRGRVVEIYGPEASGKTTLAQHIIAEAQKLGGVAAFIDAEHALDPAYAKSTGINLDELLISQPDTGEQALEIVECLVRSGGVDLVVIDSVAALVPRVEIDGDMGDSHMGVQARLMSQALRKLGPIVNKSKSSVIFTNQIRQKIGVVFGNPETTPGGLALKFHASVRLEIRRVSSIKVGQDVVGNIVKVKVVKNKVAPPFKEAEFDITFGEGISKEGNLLDVAVSRKIVEKGGAWFNYGKERLGQGRENAKQFLKEHSDIAAEIEREIRSSLGVKQPLKDDVKLEKVEDEIAIPEEDEEDEENEEQ